MRFRTIGWVAPLAAAGSRQAWAQESAASAGSQPPETFLAIVFSGGPVGIAIMLVLIVMSVLSAYLVFEHVLRLRRHELLPAGLGDEVRQLLLAGRLADAEQACRASPSVLGYVLLQGLAEVEGGWSAVEKSLEDAVAEQSARLFRKLEYLNVLANLSPMVGLLGTVVGMILCFHQVARTQGSAGAADLAEGIYQALVTTVVGLMIAIPALGAFAVFRNRIDQYIAEASGIALHVFGPLKRSKASPSRRAAPQPPPLTEGGR